MFFVRNFISFATVRRGSIAIGEVGSGPLLKSCFAADTAAAMFDWFLRCGRRESGGKEVFCRH
jgi:hypothetical protein